MDSSYTAQRQPNSSISSPWRAMETTMGSITARTHQLVSEPFFPSPQSSTDHNYRYGYGYRPQQVAASDLEIYRQQQHSDPQIYHHQVKVLDTHQWQQHHHSQEDQRQQHSGHLIHQEFQRNYQVQDSHQQPNHHYGYGYGCRQHQDSISFAAATSDLGDRYASPEEGEWWRDSSQQILHHRAIEGAIGQQSRSTAAFINLDQQKHRDPVSSSAAPRSCRRIDASPIIEDQDPHLRRLDSSYKNFRSDDLSEKSCRKKEAAVIWQRIAKKVEDLRSITLDFAQLKAEAYQQGTQDPQQVCAVEDADVSKLKGEIKRSPPPLSRATNEESTHFRSPTHHLDHQVSESKTCVGHIVITKARDCKYNLQSRVARRLWTLPRKPRPPPKPPPKPPWPSTKDSYSWRLTAIMGILWRFIIDNITGGRARDHRGPTQGAALKPWGPGPRNHQRTSHGFFIKHLVSGENPQRQNHQQRRENTQQHFIKHVVDMPISAEDPTRSSYRQWSSPLLQLFRKNEAKHLQLTTPKKAHSFGEIGLRGDEGGDLMHTLISTWIEYDNHLAKGGEEPHLGKGTEDSMLENHRLAMAAKEDLSPRHGCDRGSLILIGKTKMGKEFSSSDRETRSISTRMKLMEAKPLFALDIAHVAMQGEKNGQSSSSNSFNSILFIQVGQVNQLKKSKAHEPY